MNTKPWYASETVWGAMGAVLASAGSAYVSYKAGNMEIAMASVGAAFSGLIALIGRFKATSVIGSDPKAPAIKP